MIMLTNLLWRNLVSGRPQVDLLVDVHTGDDKEDPRTPSSSGEESAQPEDDGPLVLLEDDDNSNNVSLPPSPCKRG